MLSKIIRFLPILIFFVAMSCKKKEIINITVIPEPADPPQFETPFADVPTPSDMVLYEINQRAFSATGTFAGILPRLDSIKALGVNVIWLMPIHPIGTIKTVNSPYCIQDYNKVSSEYGSLDDLRNLVRQAHQRKIAVIMDWAANHTAWDNPWISNKSWYTQDVNGNIVIPAGTNWQDVADLNFDNAAMRLEMIRAMKYWVLTANVDGFRCDAADFVPFAFWKQALDSLKKIPNRKLVLLAEGARADHFDAGFQLNFGWDFFNANKNVFKNNQSATTYFSTHQTEYSRIPTGSQKLRFTSNHDECAWDDTALGLFGGKNGSLSAFVISTYMGGVPLIYTGQEVGCAVKLPFFSRSPVDWTTNPDMFQIYKNLMIFRSLHPALRTGDLESYADNDVAAFKRKAGNDEVLVIANTRNTGKTFAIPAALQNTIWFDAATGLSVTLGNSLVLNAFEYRIFKK
jgi:glycosidase